MPATLTTIRGAPSHASARASTLIRRVARAPSVPVADPLLQIRSARAPEAPASANVPPAPVASDSASTVTGAAEAAAGRSAQASNAAVRMVNERGTVPSIGRRGQG